METKTVTIYCKNTKQYYDFPIGSSLLEIYNALQIQLPYQVVAARVNYKVEDLNFLVYKPKDIEFIDASTPSGMRCYVRTLSMVLSCAINELYPHADLRIEHPISKGYYCIIDKLGQILTPDIVLKIKERMSQIIQEDRKIICDCDDAKGNYIIIKHNNGEYSTICHFERDSFLVKQGDLVKEGEILGKVGNSGNTQGPHIHFQVQLGIDPDNSKGIPITFKNAYENGKKRKTIEKGIEIEGK